MRQLDFEKNPHTQSLGNSQPKEPWEHDRPLTSIREPLMGSSTAAEKITRPQGRVSMTKLMASSGQANAAASLLQLQRQHGNHYVQRFLQLARGKESEGDVVPDVERAIESSRGGGQYLDRGVQAQMGQALNADFSGVRVHTNAEADGLNQSLSARGLPLGGISISGRESTTQGVPAAVSF